VGHARWTVIAPRQPVGTPIPYLRSTVKETDLTVVGNVVNAPQRSRLASGATVTNFRVASTSRRFDRETQTWADNRTLFLDVECWGELGGNVSHTVSKGDPVIVVGELYTHEWETEQGRRSRPQLRAESVGPDLARGVADFRRTARNTAVPGSPEQPVADEAPIGDDPYGDRSTDYLTGEEALHSLDSDGSENREAVPALT
jgi:single-strand DNA-binding protein